MGCTLSTPLAISMTNNDVLRSLRYILDIRDVELAALFELGGSFVETRDVKQMLLFDNDAAFRHCTDDLMADVLDGLVYHKRGKDETRPAPPQEFPVTNNMVLKKFRVAFELKDSDMHEIMESVGFPISKPEMSAFFRKLGHKNYKECGDQFLRNFFKGLAQRVRAAD
jgi:uncharacterized protein YehS (DUF1456 family)